MTLLSRSRVVCTPELKSECALNLAVASYLEGLKDSKKQARALRQLNFAEPELRPIWATLALGRWVELSDREWRLVVGALADHWGKVDVSTKYLLVPRILSIIPSSLKAEARRVTAMPISSDEKTLLRRIEALKRLEERAAAVAGIPLESVRAVALGESYRAYADLVNDLKGLAAPSGAGPREKAEHQKLLSRISHPFLLKSRRILDQAHVAEQQMRLAVAPDELRRIWKSADGESASFARIKEQWLDALRDESWSRVAFFADEAATVRGVPVGWLKAARAASLAEAGAETEAGVIFLDACRISGNLESLAKACRTALKRAGKGRG